MPRRFGAGTLYLSYRPRTKALWRSGSSRSSDSTSLSSGMPGGSTRFTPMGASPASRLSWASSSRISCGVRRVAPYVPSPPQRDTAAATDTEWLNANTGWASPNIRVAAVSIGAGRGPRGACGAPSVPVERGADDVST